MNFKIVFPVLLSICLITFQCFIENAIQIIKKKLNNDCIFIIKPDFTENESNVRFLKILSLKKIVASIVTLDNSHRIITELQCFRPLLVHLDPNKTLHQTLHLDVWNPFVTPIILIPSCCCTQPFHEPLIQHLSDSFLVRNKIFLVSKYKTIEEWWRISNQIEWRKTIWSQFQSNYGAKKLENIELRVGAGVDTNLLKNYRTSNGSIASFGGYYGNVFYLLQSALQFKAQFKFEDHVGNDVNQNGNDVNQNGNWSGLMGLLQRREIDLAIASFTRLTSRLTHIHYLYDLKYISFEMFVKKPKFFDMVMSDYLTILDIKMWICFLLAFLFAYLMDYLLYKILKPNPLSKYEWSESLLSIIGVFFCIKGYYQNPTCLSGQIHMITILLLPIVIYGAYVGYLTAEFAIEILDLPFQTFEEMIEKQEYALGVPKPSPLYEIFNNSKENIFSRLFQGPMRKSNAYFPINSMDGLLRLCEDDKLAFATYNSYYMEFRRHSCSLTKIPGRLFMTSSSMAVPKKSNYFRYFNKIIVIGHECGLLNRLQKPSLTGQRKFNIEKLNIDLGKEFDPVDFGDINFQLAILATGILLAFLFLIIENIIYYNYNNNNNIQDR